MGRKGYSGTAGKTKRIIERPFPPKFTKRIKRKSRKMKKNA